MRTQGKKHLYKKLLHNVIKIEGISYGKKKFHTRSSVLPPNN
jgi:hypothetical protein